MAAISRTRTITASEAHQQVLRLVYGIHLVIKREIIQYNVELADTPLLERNWDIQQNDGWAGKEFSNIQDVEQNSMGYVAPDVPFTCHLFVYFKFKLDVTTIMTTIKFRSNPLEVFECRHCETEAQSSDKAEIASQLCKSCFEIREQYRKTNPRKADKKAELHWGEEPFGKNRGGRRLICASCSKEYALVPLSFHDHTESEIADARAYFDKMAPFREMNGKSGIKFKAEVFDYTNAPKGWTNEILCKSCFESLPETFSLEIEKVTQDMLSAQAQRIAHEKAIEEKRREQASFAGIARENPIDAIGLVIVLVASALALLKFMSTGIALGWKVASQASPGGKIIFFVLLGIGYLASIPWLRDKGGGYRDLSVVMSLIAGIAFALLVMAIMPSCNPDSGFNSQGELPYFRR